MAISVSNLSFTVSEHNNIQTRIQSSVYSKKTNSDKIVRPKSTPIKFNPDGLDSFYLTPRNQTAPTYIHNLSGYNHCCNRSKQVNSESVKQYRFPSANNKRVISTSPSSTKVTEEPQQVYNLGPGYVMYRNDTEFTIRIDSDDFFGPRKKIERESTTKDVLIGELQEQIVSLSVALEEEKMNHNISIAAWQDKLESTRTTIINNYEDVIGDLKNEHLHETKNLNNDHALAMLQQKDKLEQKIGSGLRELNTYKASFESFRQSLIKETEEKFESHKNILNNDFEEHLTKKLDKQKCFLSANFEVDMERNKQEHFAEIEKIDAKHRSEIETLNRRFTDVAALEDKLSHTLQELTKRKKDIERAQVEYSNLYEMYSSVRKEMTFVRSDNENLKSELQEFSDRFEERIQRVDDDYKQRMDALHNQIVEIRRAYMAKCEEIVQERKNADNQLQGRIETAKDVMKELIHTRQRSRISLVSIDNDTDLTDLIASRRKSQEFVASLDVPATQLVSGAVTDVTALCRPLSAPTTDKDEKRAMQNIFLNSKNDI